MTAVELATCCVPEDSVSPAPAGGYVVASVVFYEPGFGVPSHRFLCLLLQFYGLELHHLTSSGILHIAAFACLLCVRPTWGLIPTLSCGITSSAPGYGWARTRKRWCAAVLISLSDLGQESIHTSTYQCLTHQRGGGIIRTRVA
jgi:hypothetical protein